MISWIKGIFSKAIRAFKSLVMMALPVGRQIILGHMSSFALQIVHELNNTDLNNEDKRKEAFDQIKRHAKKEGVELRDSLASLLIEMAVLSFKKEF